MTQQLAVTVSISTGVVPPFPERRERVMVPVGFEDTPGPAWLNRSRTSVVAAFSVTVIRLEVVVIVGLAALHGHLLVGGPIIAKPAAQYYCRSPRCRWRPPGRCW